MGAPTAPVRRHGNVVSTDVSAHPPSGGGTFGFVEQDSHDNLPDGVTSVEMPYSFTTIRDPHR